MYKKFEIKNIISNFTGQKYEYKIINKYGTKKVTKSRSWKQEAPLR